MSDKTDHVPLPYDYCEQPCPHPEWNVATEVSTITEPPIAAGNFLVKFIVSCGYCGLTLQSIDDGRVVPHLETVMYR